MGVAVERQTKLILMKKFLILFMAVAAALTLDVVAAFAQAPADSTGTGGINVGGLHIGWGLISAIVIGIEGILRALPTGKYASFLGLLGWLNDLIPAKKKTETNQ